jgi:hypothetical protein
MQPMPHPDSWLITWFGEQHLQNDEILATYVKKVAEAKLQHPLLDPNPPTLGGLLERDGLLTRDQREAGEREAARRQSEFMKWRAQALREQQHRPPPG